MANPILETQKLGQSIWYDNVRRGLLTSGELAELVKTGVTGLTSNPTIFEKAISGSSDYDEALLALALEGRSSEEAFERMALEDIRAVADLLRPVYDATNGVDGYASLEVSPTLAHDTEGTVIEALRLFAELGRPNVMVKVPATAEGIPAIEQLIGQGVNINVTLLFHLDAYRRVREAYTAGLEHLVAAGGDPSKVASVASFFVSRVDTVVDALLESKIQNGESGLEHLLGKAAIANAALAYRDFRETVASDRFSSLQAKGAQVQRPLWASTGTKNPAYSDVLYIETLIGPDTVNTMPPATLTSFLDHGNAKPTLADSIEEAETIMADLDASGVSITEVTDKLLVDGVNAFADSFNTLMANVEEKKARLLAKQHASSQVSLGDHQEAVEATLSELGEADVPGRIWRKDHTVWKPDPTEIADRLGWLTVTDLMEEQAANLRAFAKDVKDKGVRHVVLLGMGGSSLGPEVLRSTFGSAPGYPELIVLDSTVPDWIQSVTDVIDPAHTLFLVSSKSGGTVETMTAYRYFRAIVDKTLGETAAGNCFVAITDSESPLERLAKAEGFLRVFANPSTIGGRYSVLSYFGMVPACLAGIDVSLLLDRADHLRESSASCVPTDENPGVWLGSVMATMAKAGHDKLTVLTSPTLSSFGLWAEQLIAESLGKEGMGIIPVAREPLLAPQHYGDDRLFVYLRLDGDNATGTDAGVEALRAAGHPIVQLDLRDRFDIGAEFYRWEFAIAVAGAVLEVNPFNQPNVQSAKDKTAEVLKGYAASGSLPGHDAPTSLTDLLEGASAGDYLAIMAYVEQTPETDTALESLRRQIMEKHRIATTVGYGPRFLHSTGQLHKGGPITGLFLQITTDYQHDIAIPGEDYSFGTLADAQSLGDLQTLESLGRRTAKARLTGDVAAGIEQLHP
jgi:transaldolase/glucose-6-phosphate isomerase